MQTVGNQTIDGRDWLRTDITYEQNVENAFNTVALQNTVQGKSQVNGTLVTGLSTIAPDTALTPATM